jgi:hypothetical protein
MIAGSVRGYSSRSHPVQRRAQPARTCIVAAPHTAQYRAWSCQLSKPTAVVSRPAAVSSSTAPADRRSRHWSEEPRSTRSAQ